MAENAVSGPARDRVVVLEPGGGDRRYWAELWAYRELFLVFAWRDLSVRYKQSVLGIAWALVRPLAAVVVFTVVFGQVAGLPGIADVPYAVVVFAGMLPWFLMSSVLSGAAGSVVANASIVTRIYFPRLVVPAASSIVALADALVALALLALMMLAFGVLPGWQIVFLPLFLALAVVAGFGPALYLAPLNVLYRDLHFRVPFLVQLGLYVSPVGFVSGVVPEGWRLVYSLNPAVAVIDGVRWSLFGAAATPYWPGMALGVAVNGLLLWLGLRAFRRAERQFADVL